MPAISVTIGTKIACIIGPPDKCSKIACPILTHFAVHFGRYSNYSKVKPNSVRVPKIVTYGSPCDQNPGCARTNGARITADKFKQFWVSDSVIFGQFTVMHGPSLVTFRKTSSVVWGKCPEG